MVVVIHSKGRALLVYTLLLGPCPRPQNDLLHPADVAGEVADINPSCNLERYATAARNQVALNRKVDV
jgi:hypothetical protein